MPWEPQNPGARLEQGSALLGPHDLYFQTGDLQGLESLSLHLPPLKQLFRRERESWGRKGRHNCLLSRPMKVCAERGNLTPNPADTPHVSTEEPPLGAPPKQRLVLGHAQGEPTAHTGQRGLQSEWQVNAVQL